MNQPYDNTNRGAIWKNERMRPDKQDADFTGSINVDGVDYWLNGWRRKADAKPEAPAMSISIRRKEVAPTSHQPPAPVAIANAYADDDIPF